MYTLQIEGRPVPKKRPRVVKGHAYTPRETSDQETLILTQWINKYNQIELNGELEIICGFYYSDKRVADTSNLLKLVEDALGGGGEGYHPFNDRQIANIHGYRVKGREEEKTIVVVREI